MVKLACLFIAEDLGSLTIVEPEMVNLEKPGVLESEDEGCFLGLRRTSGESLIFSTFLFGVLGILWLGVGSCSWSSVLLVMTTVS